MKYTILEGSLGQNIIQREDENGTIVFIPMDEGNSDYQAYLKRDEPQVEHLTEIPTPDEA